MAQAKGKHKRMILIVILIIFAAFFLSSSIAAGYLGGMGPLKFLRENRLKALPGNGEAYHLDNIQPVDDSPLAGKRILFLGSSVTFGSASLEVSMADYIAVADGCEVYKEAKSGTTLVDNGSDSYVSRLKKVDASQQFDAVICQLSTNDASKKLPLGAVSSSTIREEFDTQTVAGALEYIISYVQETWNCPVVIYTGTKYESTEYQAMVDLLPSLQEKWGIGVIDLWNDADMNAVSPEDYQLYMFDKIHPTQAGYLEWWTPKFEEYLYEFLL